MNEIAIKLKGVSKKYTIGKEKDGSLRSEVTSLFSGRKSSTDEFWALRDVSFEVEKGDVVGIIGKNGAGKSTLLKILSQITRPAEGKIEINGRIASLLEVGTGFHPELTGRENIFLNGTILGMTRKEVASKFDEIVAFSGIEKFIDTPVKHYSSGMYVRLAFAVAAHLEPEILIIDEVLAVGDAEFQKKCLGKMKDVAGQGRTVIFVSHDLAAVSVLCDKGVFLKNGRVELIGSVQDCIMAYSQGNAIEYNSFIDLSNHKRERGNKQLIFSQITFNQNIYYPNSALEVTLKLSLQDQQYKPDHLNFGFHVIDQFDYQIYHLSNIFLNKENIAFNVNDEFIFSITELRLKPGKYKIWLWLQSNGDEQDFINEGIGFEVSNGNVYGYSKSSIISGIVQPNFNFDIK